MVQWQDGAFFECVCNKKTVCTCVSVEIVTSVKRRQRLRLYKRAQMFLWCKYKRKRVGDIGSMQGKTRGLIAQECDRHTKSVLIDLCEEKAISALCVELSGNHGSTGKGQMWTKALPAPCVAQGFDKTFL